MEEALGRPPQSPPGGRERGTRGTTPGRAQGALGMLSGWAPGAHDVMLGRARGARQQACPAKVAGALGQGSKGTRPRQQ